MTLGRVMLFWYKTKDAIYDKIDKVDVIQIKTSAL